MCNFERTKVFSKVNKETRSDELRSTVLLAKSQIQKELGSGGDGIEVTLLPIPNRTVKVYNADGTAWETVWKSRKLRGKMARQLSRQSRGLKILVSLVRFQFEPPYMALQPSGKAEVCKTFIPQFKSGWCLQNFNQQILILKVKRPVDLRFLSPADFLFFTFIFPTQHKLKEPCTDQMNIFHFHPYFQKHHNINFQNH